MNAFYDSKCADGSGYVEEQLERFRVTCFESFAIRPVRNVNKSKFIFVKI